MLWPGPGAQTVEQFVHALPAASPWRTARGGDGANGDGTNGDGSNGRTSVDGSNANGGGSSGGGGGAAARPVLRVVVLDAVYRHARTMFRHLARSRAARPLQHVALHPKTLSVYSRAQHGYAQASAASIAAI